MGIDVQKASLWKRIAAWMLDVILLAVLAVGAAWGLSAALGYDSYSNTLESAYAKYEAQYGVTFQIDGQAYDTMTAEGKQNYDTAYQALIADADAMYAYNMVVNLSLLITTLGILAAVLVLELLVPLLLKNGQTVGKKCFTLGVMRTDGVKMNNLQLFARTVLGKYTIELMVPIYIAMMVFWGSMDITGTLVLLGLLLGQIICLCATRTNAAIHDLLAGTVVVDIASQKIFNSTEDLLEYTKRIHADRARRQDY